MSLVYHKNPRIAQCSEEIRKSDFLTQIPPEITAKHVRYGWGKGRGRGMLCRTRLVAENQVPPRRKKRNYGFTTRKTDVALKGTYGGRSIAVRQMIRGVASAQGTSQILAYRFGVGLSNECGLTLSLGRKGSLRRLQAFFGRPEKASLQQAGLRDRRNQT